MNKRRTTVTIDENLLAAAQAAVSNGMTDSVSSWINEAMVVRQDRDQRLSNLADLIADYEDEHGVITDDELAEQQQADRDAAAILRQSKVRRAG